MIDEEAKQKARARLSRIEGQVQGVQRMTECVSLGAEKGVEGNE